MNYFSVSFHYPGPTSNFGELPESNRTLFKAEDIVEEVMEFAGIEMIHQYSWPDGSLYKYIRADINPETIQDVLEFLFKSTKLRIETVYQHDADDMINENVSSLKDRFNQGELHRHPSCSYLGGYLRPHKRGEKLKIWKQIGNKPISEETCAEVM